MTPELLILGQITIDHVVPAEPGHWYERLGGNALYAAAGARLWCDSSRIGLVARRGPNMPASLGAMLAASGLTDSGIVPAATENMVAAVAISRGPRNCAMRTWMRRRGTRAISRANTR
jgi:hypothetical protein